MGPRAFSKQTTIFLFQGHTGNAVGKDVKCNINAVRNQHQERCLASGIGLFLAVFDLSAEIPVRSALLRSHVRGCSYQGPSASCLWYDLPAEALQGPRPGFSIKIQALWSRQCLRSDSSRVLQPCDRDLASWLSLQAELPQVSLG